MAEANIGSLRKGETIMAAYLVTEIEITDPAGYEEYRKGVGATLAAYGGRNLVRPGGKMEVLEGEWVPKRLVILEFPSIAQLKAWYGSPEYRPLLEIRLRTAKSKMIMIEGV
jgi:uncharacterized protein (DUF1330 family)